MAKFATLAACFTLVVPILGQAPINCKGLQEPNWDDCKTIIDGLPDSICSSAGQCQAFFSADHTLNCHVGYCADDCTTKDDMTLEFELARNNCEDEKAGAVLILNGRRYEFTNDADLEPPTTSSRIKRGVRPNVIHQSIPKRQESSDNRFNLIRISESVIQPGVQYPIGGPRPAGSTFTSTNEVSESTSVGFSSTVESGFLDILSASVSFSLDETQTITSATGETININCSPGQDGQVFWKPFFNAYYGTWQPSGDELTVWQPIAGSSGRYDVECLG